MLVKIKGFVKKYAHLIVLIGMGFIPFTWWKPGYLIGRGESFPVWMNALNTFPRHLFIWDEHYLGHISNWCVTLIDEALWYFFLSLGCKPDLVQILVEVLLMMVSAFSMYYLAYTIYKNRLVSVVASVAWVFNFHRMYQIWSLYRSFVEFAFIPLIFALFIKIQDNAVKNRSTFNKIMLFGLIFSIFNSMELYPPITLYLVSSLVILFIAYLLLNRHSTNSLKMLLRTNFVLFSVTLLLSLWWVVPYYFVYVYPTITPCYSTALWISSESLLEYLKGNVNIFSIFALITSNSWWHARAWGFAFSDFYKSIPDFIFYIPTLLAFLNLLFKDKRNRRRDLYIALAALPLIFLGKGVHAPLEELSTIIWLNTPMKYIRQAGDCAMIYLLICISLLLGSLADKIYSSSTFKNISKLKLKYVAIIILIIVIILPAYPMLIGGVVPGRYLTNINESSPLNVYFELPTYWSDMSEYINKENEDFKILILPLNPDETLITYSPWYWGRPIEPILFSKPVIMSGLTSYFYSGYLYPLRRFYSSIEHGDHTTFLRMLRFTNTKYILYKGETPDANTEKFLKDAWYIALDRDLGKLKLYKLKDDYFVSNVFVVELNYSSGITLESNFTSKNVNFSEFENALYFNKSYIFIPYDKSMDTRDQITIESEFLINNSRTDVFPTIVSRTTDDGLALWHICCIGGGVSFGLRINRSWYAVTGDHVYDGRWHHIVGVYDGNFMKLYIDGILVGQRRVNGAVDISKKGLFIGAYNGSQHFFKGFIRYVRIYNRALTNHEIIKNMHGEVIRKGLIKEYSFMTVEPRIIPVEYKKVNPTKYIVHINSSKPVRLVLSENFDPMWKIYSGDVDWFEAIFKKPFVDENRHSVANGYANSWELKPGKYTLTIYYLPQSYLYLSWIIFFLTLFFGSAYILRNRLAGLMEILNRMGKKRNL